MQADNILVRGVNWLGDAVMSTPTLQRLRESFPHASITLLTPAKLAALWDHYPHVDRVMAFNPGQGFLSVARQLRPRRFDLALILPNSPRSALESFLARIPCRLGYARPWRNPLLTHRVPPRPGEVRMHKPSPAQIQRLIRQKNPPPPPAWPAQAHHVHQYLHLLSALGSASEPAPPRLEVLPSEVDAMRARLGTAWNEAPFWLGLNAGAEYGPAKRWPEDHFVQTATLLHRQSGCGWILLGGPADVPLAQRLAATLSTSQAGPLLNLAGQTSLRELAACFRLCRALLTNDTGPMHLAAAVGTPVVALFGSTSPELTGPDAFEGPDCPHHILRSPTPCAPCFLRDCPIDLRCLTRISPAQAALALHQAARL